MTTSETLLLQLYYWLPIWPYNPSVHSNHTCTTAQSFYNKRKILRHRLHMQKGIRQRRSPF